MKKYILALLVILTLAQSLTACTPESGKEPEESSTLNSTTINSSSAAETSMESTSEVSTGSFTETTELPIIPVTPKKNEETTAKNIPIDAPTEKNTVTQATSKDREPLALGDFSSFDPNNTKGLPTKKIEHAYGVAKNAKPHTISLDNQRFFDEKGYNALALDTKSEGKVLYLTFDCGYENGYTSKILDVLAQKNVKAAFFCTLSEMRENGDLISRMINEGHIVGNHTAKHPSFAEISRTRMAQELQEFDDYLRTNFAYTAPVFRFPKGEYTESALELVQSLGYRSIFWSVAYSDWDLNNQKGKSYAVETVTSRLHPGAVILLHSVSPDNAAALGDIIDWAKNEGYTFKELL